MDPPCAFFRGNKAGATRGNPCNLQEDSNLFCPCVKRLSRWGLLDLLPRCAGRTALSSRPAPTPYTQMRSLAARRQVALSPADLLSDLRGLCLPRPLPQRPRDVPAPRNLPPAGRSCGAARCLQSGAHGPARSAGRSLRSTPHPAAPHTRSAAPAPGLAAGPPFRASPARGAEGEAFCRPGSRGGWGGVEPAGWQPGRPRARGQRRARGCGGPELPRAVRDPGGCAPRPGRASPGHTIRVVINFKRFIVLISNCCPPTENKRPFLKSPEM